MKKLIIPLLVSSLFNMAYAATDKSETNKPAAQTSNSEELSPEARFEKYKKENDIRITAIKQFYMEKGLAEGRLQMFQTQQDNLKELEPLLNRIYKVSHLYMDNGKLQPPVILMGKQLFQMQPDGQRYDESRIRYQTAAKERYVTTQLDWKSFLISDDDLVYRGPSGESFLSPRNTNEEDVAKQFYLLGFNEGANQVQQELDLRIKALTNIIVGMYNFYNVSTRGLLTMPEIVKSYTPVTGNQTQLTLSTETKEIAVPARFDLDSNNYMAVVGAPPVQ